MPRYWMIDKAKLTRLLPGGDLRGIDLAFLQPGSTALPPNELAAGSGAASLPELVALCARGVLLLEDRVDLGLGRGWEKVADCPELGPGLVGQRRKVRAVKTAITASIVGSLLWFGLGAWLLPESGLMVAVIGFLVLIIAVPVALEVAAVTVWLRRTK